MAKQKKIPTYKIVQKCFERIDIEGSPIYSVPLNEKFNTSPSTCGRQNAKLRVC